MSGLPAATSALFTLAFAVAPPVTGLTGHCGQLAGSCSKRHAVRWPGQASPSTACKQTVSGSISLPSPGCFSPFPHGTVRYRSLCVSSLGEWAPQLHTRLLVSGATQALLDPQPRAAPTRLSRSMATLSRRLRRQCGWVRRAAARLERAYNPAYATPAGLTHTRFGRFPVRSPLLRELFLFLGVREMFQFPRCPPPLAVTTFGSLGCPIRRS